MGGLFDSVQMVGKLDLRALVGDLMIPKLQKIFSPLWKRQKPKAVGLSEQASPVAIFIHGFTGNPVDTWGKWLVKIATDRDLKNLRADTYCYQTSIFTLPFGMRVPGIAELAAGLGTDLNHLYPKSSEVILVGHSMGGLVARYFLLSEARQDRPLERYRLIMYGTPHNGAELATLVRQIGVRHGQLAAMGVTGEFIDELNTDWDRLGLSERIPLRYVVGGGDQVVTPESAGFRPGDPKVEVAIDLDHQSLVDINHPLPCTIFKSFVKSTEHRDGDPLFTIYHRQDEPYYYKRAGVDIPLGKAISTRHVWLYGESGYGKTSLIRRNSLFSGWRLVYISLSSVQSSSARDLQLAFFSRLADALNHPDIQGGDGFMRVCRKIAQSGPTCFLVEEIPHPGDSTLGEVATWFSDLAEMIDVDASTKGSVRLAFTSIPHPLRGTLPQAAKVKDRISFMPVPSWSITELADLADLLATRLSIQLTADQRSHLVASSMGHPRLIKEVFRGLTFGLNPTASFDSIVEGAKADVL